MRRLIGIVVFLLIMGMSPTAIAQNCSITVTPAIGSVANVTFDFTLYGFQGPGNIQIEVYRRATGSMVFSQMIAPDTGQSATTYSLRSDDSDAPDTYTLHASNSVCSASVQFTLTGFDRDRDGIPDDIETWVANNYAPVLEMDEHEFVQRDRVKFLYQVTPRSFAGVDGISLVYVVMFPIDVVVVDAGFDWIPILQHFGDSERIEIFISTEGLDFQAPDFDWHRIQYIWLTRHHHTYGYYPTEIEEWTDRTHPVIHVSQGKHGSYASYDECEDHDFSKWGFGWDEDCDDGYRIIAEPWPDLNVGERDVPLIYNTDEVSDLRAVFSRREAVWDNTSRFCGGFLVPVPDEFGFAKRGDYDLRPYSSIKTVHFLRDEAGIVGQGFFGNITDLIGVDGDIGEFLVNLTYSLFSEPHQCAGGLASKWHPNFTYDG